MATEKVQPNETANELEDQRRDRLNSFIKDKKFGQKSDDNEDTSEKNQEKLDKDQKNSYINNDDESNDEDVDKQTSDNDQDSEDSSDEEQTLDEYQKVLDETFGGDGKKAVKSWKEASRNYTKLRKQAKNHEQKLNYLEKLVQKNPVLGDMLETAAEKGELTKDDVQSFLNEGRREPKGKPSTSDESKLEVVDKVDVKDIDEKTLVESGYLNDADKDSLSPSEWRLLKRQAAVEYAEDNLPQKLAQQAYKNFREQIVQERERRKEEEAREKNRQLNEQRYEQGVDRVIDEFNLDFAGNEKHEEMLEEIESLAVNIRDPQNNNVIHPNAIYLATVEVMKERGMEPQQSTDVDEEVEQARQSADESFDKRTGFNANTKQPGEDEPETLADKLSRAHLSQYEKERERRVKTGRISSDN